MKNLNAVEIVELEGEAQEFVRNRALDGMACVVILMGRGFSYVGYPEELAPEIPRLLERAYLSAHRRNLGRQDH